MKTIDAMKQLVCAWDEMMATHRPSALFEHVSALREAIAREEAQTVEPVSYEELLGAITRGWCTPQNERKIMDEQLAFAIAAEVVPLLTRPANKEVVVNADYREMWEEQVRMNQRLCSQLAAPATETVKLPENCGTGHCSCIECVVEPAKPSAGEREALIHWLRERSMWDGMLRLGDAADMLAADALEIEQTCNCRFVGEINTVQCTLHNAWAETLNEQSGYRKELHTLKAQQVAVPQGSLVEDLSMMVRRLVLAIRRNVDDPHRDLTLANDCLKWLQKNGLTGSPMRDATPQPPQATAQKSGDAHEIWAAAQLAPGEGIEDGVLRVEALLDAPRVPMTELEARDIWKERDSINVIRKVERFHGIGVKS